MTQPKITWRTDPIPADVQAVERLAAGSGFFNDAEVAVARELVEERLAKGLASGYLFLFAEEGTRLWGYACYGPIAGSLASWDLYWIVVEPSARGMGIGSLILAEMESRAVQEGAQRVYVETSSRELYGPTRGFYLAKGYRVEAELAGFYAPGDAKIILAKGLT